MNRALSSRALAASAAACALLLCAIAAHATVVVQLTRARQLELSDMVVRGSVLDQRYQWNEDHSQMLTLTRVRVTQYVVGGGPQEIIVRQFGGQLDGMVSEVPGDGQLSQGQDVVLFLRRGAGVAYLTALAQSVYYVVHTPGQPPAVRRDLRELSFAIMNQGSTQIVPPPTDPAETLDHLITDVRALAAAGGR